ncbi:hypothetical protein AB0S59_15040, partial [Escherichia coli]
PEGLYSAKTFSEEEMPSFGVSVWTSLVPVVFKLFGRTWTLDLKDNDHTDPR